MKRPEGVKRKKNPLPYFTQSGEDREENGGQYIANLRHGSWCGFKYLAFDGSESKLTVTVRGDAAGTLKVSTDRSLAPVASILIKPSENWAAYSGKREIPDGTAPLYFTFEGSGGLDFTAFEIR